MLSKKELETLGLKNIGKIHHNLSYDELISYELNQSEAKMTTTGATTVDTGIFTGRSPKDKYFVVQDPSKENVAWGDINQPISSDIFDELFDATSDDIIDYLSDSDIDTDILLANL